jgi:hypothetical protein
MKSVKNQLIFDLSKIHASFPLDFGESGLRSLVNNFSPSKYCKVPVISRWDEPPLGFVTKCYIKGNQLYADFEIYDEFKEDFEIAKKGVTLKLVEKGWCLDSVSVVNPVCIAQRINNRKINLFPGLKSPTPAEHRSQAISKYRGFI